MLYELREQFITSEDCMPAGKWHIVESGWMRALCGHSVALDEAARPLADLSDIDLDCACDKCEQIHRDIAARGL
ncbi:hypothetical protein [Streptacidiphilus rugosus]|uniref:hypothetical protein n=1 Tax=Streptacidiphilus rugosus TaxID=405783 RepID=UPI00055DF4C7|nr:hypothetical protein [Streptacidiphilus rugosus]